MLGFSALGAFMANITDTVGQLVEGIADAVSDWGTYLIGQAQDPEAMNVAAFGYFATGEEEGGPGLLYWINDKLMYWIEWIKANPDWANFQAFLEALAEAGLI